ncbi:MAG: exonuclease domain-containing protein [Planctomycetota bacterium]|nr:exonuclease domain-containing protein [Planctomycetota bacterium]
MTTPAEAIPELPRSGEMVVFDLEWTAWEGSLARSWSGPGEYREVIQVGAVRLDAVRFEPLGVFDRLVRPVRNPVLSDYIVRLSGITNQRMLAEGVSLEAALAEFAAFVANLPVWCNGGDAAVLRENCVLQAILCPVDTGRIGNVRPLLARATGLPASRLVSCELPELLGIGAGRDCHTGAGDAIAIASALAALRTRGLL